MTPHLLDNPLILSALFYPRAEMPNTSRLPHVSDGTIPVTDGIVLGYRFYAYPPDAPVVLYFHGNGEVASDYDDFAPEFQRAGAALLVVDYRGYGWSTGKPLISTLLSDAEAVLAAVPTIIGSERTLFIMGRSLGSAPATHLAYSHPEAFKGLIIESGFAHAPSVFGRITGLPQALLSKVPDVFGNGEKMRTVNVPLLVIHGERDTLIPVENGQTLYDASPTVDKTILRIPRAGHNDLLFYGIDAYFAAIKTFITGHI